MIWAEFLIEKKKLKKIVNFSEKFFIAQLMKIIIFFKYLTSFESKKKWIFLGKLLIDEKVINYFKKGSISSFSPQTLKKNVHIFYTTSFLQC